MLKQMRSKARKTDDCLSRSWTGPSQSPRPFPAPRPDPKQRFWPCGGPCVWGEFPACVVVIRLSEGGCVGATLASRDHKHPCSRTYLMGPRVCSERPFKTLTEGLLGPFKAVQGCSRPHVSFLHFFFNERLKSCSSSAPH